MKSIVKSQLTGKWYKLTRDFRSRELKFAEIFIYLSVNGLRTTNNSHLDLLYVGVKEDRNKILRKMSLRTVSIDDCNYLIIRKFLFCKKYRVLLFDEENGILILSDKRMKKISIYSRKYKVTPDVIESYFRKIDFKSSVKIIIEEL